MGVDCSTCCGNETENQEQVKSDIFQSGTASRMKHDKNAYNAQSYSEQLTNGDLGDQVGKLIRLQAIVKAYLQRKKYRI